MQNASVSSVDYKNVRCSGRVLIVEWQILKCGVAESSLRSGRVPSGRAECRAFPPSHHPPHPLLPSSALVQSASVSSAQYTLQKLFAKWRKQSVIPECPMRNARVHNEEYYFL